MNKFEKCGELIVSIDGLKISENAAALYLLLLARADGQGMAHYASSCLERVLALGAAELCAAERELEQTGFIETRRRDGCCECRIIIKPQ